MEALDLDAAGPDESARRHRSLPTTLALAALLGAAGGGVLAIMTAPEIPAQPSSVVAAVVMEDAVMAPAPAAVLRLRVDNQGTARRTIRGVSVSGGGTVSTTIDQDLTIAPFNQSEIPLRVPLRCSDPPRTPLVVTVEFAPSAERGVPASVAASPLGPSAASGALCAGADALLPAGWRTPARTARWQITDGLLDVTVTGLPREIVQVVSVEADGLPLPQSGDAVTMGPDGVRILVGPPSGGGKGTARPVTPTGIQLRLQTEKGFTSVHVPLGPAVSQWLLDSRGRDGSLSSPTRRADGMPTGARPPR
jgi:hypothetical protein